MSHSKMLTTRRRKKKAQKETDRIAKEAKRTQAGATSARGNAGGKSAADAR